MPGEDKFLMPGLSDMHTHASSLVNRSQLYLLHGVTTVRDAACVPELFEWRAGNPAGVAMVPEVYAPGPVLEGEKPKWKGFGFSRVVVGKEQVEAAIIEAQGWGADFIKVYHTLAETDYFHAAQFARSRGLKVAGHNFEKVGLDKIANVLDSIEHAHRLVRSYLADQPIQEFSQYVADILIRNNAVLCPTLMVAKQFARLNSGEPNEVLERELVGELKYIGRDMLDGSERHPERGWRAAKSKITQANFQNAAKLTGNLYRSGVRLLLGTDTNNPYVLPGHSTIQELDLLVKMTGLTPYQALRTGTVDAAEFLRVNAGTVEPGQKANLVLVDGNPLRNPAVLEKTSDVFVRGKHFTRETLENSLEVVS